MLAAIKEIGDLVSKKGLETETHIEGKVISIVIDVENSQFDVEIEDFDSAKMDLYLFKPGFSKGNVPSPFSPLTEPQKTYSKLESWLKKCKEVRGIGDEAKVLVEKINELLELKKDDIVPAIKSKLEGIPKEKGAGRYLTLKFNKDPKCSGEYEVFKKAVDHFAEEKRKKSVGSNQACSVCGLSKDEVSGKTDVFKFYTIDKPGFIAGGFKEVNAWKNFPVCAECKNSLEQGKKFIHATLNFSFYGLRYYLIPRLLVGSEDVLEEVLNILTDTTKLVGLKSRTKKKITSDDNEILEYLSEAKDTGLNPSDWTIN